jgi:hypothetical protein
LPYRSSIEYTLLSSYLAENSALDVVISSDLFGEVSDNHRGLGIGRGAYNDTVYVQASAVRKGAFTDNTDSSGTCIRIQYRIPDNDT